MKTKRIGSMLLVLAAFAVALLPQRASAQEVVTGTFTLPVEAHWGTTMLPAGNYRFSANDLSPTTLVRVSNEANPSASYFVLAKGWDQMPSGSGKSKLLLGSKDGEAYVKELQLGSAGTTLYFGAPNNRKVILARSSSPGRIPNSVEK
jgi:hypothetical protein